MHELLGRAILRRVNFIMGFWSQHHAAWEMNPVSWWILRWAYSSGAITGLVNNYI
jgi:hypothetical protein